MDKVELICVICKKEERSRGVWSYHDSPSTGEKEDGLCLDCCQELFPQFYRSYKRHSQRRPTIGQSLLTFLGRLKPQTN